LALLWKFWICFVIVLPTFATQIENFSLSGYASAHLPSFQILTQADSYISTQQFTSFLSKYNFSSKQAQNLGALTSLALPYYTTPMTRRDFTL